MKPGQLVIDVSWYLSDRRIRALTPAQRGLLVDVYCHLRQTDEPGVYRGPLLGLARALYCGVEQLHQLVDAGVIEGAGDGDEFQGATDEGRRGRQRLLIPPCKGPVWLARPILVAEYLRRCASEAGRRGGGNPKLKETATPLEARTFIGPPIGSPAAPPTPPRRRRLAEASASAPPRAADDKYGGAVGAVATPEPDPMTRKFPVTVHEQAKVIWSREWERVYRFPYPWGNGRQATAEFAALSAVLAKIGCERETAEKGQPIFSADERLARHARNSELLPRIEAVFRCYLADRSPYYSGHPLSRLKANINLFLARAQQTLRNGAPNAHEPNGPGYPRGANSDITVKPILDPDPPPSFPRMAGG